MNLKVFIGGLIAFIYNRIVGGLPIRSLRRAYLAAWLGKMGDGTSVQMGWSEGAFWRAQCNQFRMSL